MSAQELVALLEGTVAGRILRDSRGRLRFVYEDEWRRAPESYPLSLSMPLTAAEHGHATIEAFLWGLLPDNDRVIDRWARDFHAGKNAFSLLTHVGEECAGAIQLAPPDRVDDMRRARRGAVQWLDEDDIARRLRALRSDQTAWRSPGDAGQFSLAGAQAKTALLFQDGRWGVPSGRTPTNRIVKPPLVELRGHVEIEHFCLRLARLLGLPAPRSSVQHFGGEVAIVIDRYDRLLRRRTLFRLHQEDFCQALGIMPTRKYQSQGGPDPRSIVDLIREASSMPTEDVWTFVRALALSWLIAGTDAHAKNYSLLLGEQRRVRLAPLYDLGSVLLHPELESRKVKLAMKIGGKYLLDQIGLRQWIKLASELRLNQDQLVATLRSMADMVPDGAADVSRGAIDDHLPASIVGRLAARITERARICRHALN